MNEAFSKWWNSDGLIEDNPFNRDTPAFWAWEGWVAGVRAEREACALAAEAVVPRHTECGNKIAAAIRARGQE
jgi:hypothetical protein